MVSMEHGEDEEAEEQSQGTTDSETTSQMSQSQQPADDTDDVELNAELLSGHPIPATELDYPYLMMRQSMQQGREGNEHKLFLLDGTEEMFAEVIEHLDEVYPNSNMNRAQTDVREALLIAGMQNLEDAKFVLDEWGYSTRNSL